MIAQRREEAFAIPLINLLSRPYSDLFRNRQSFPRRTPACRMSDPRPSPWWSPERHRDRRPFLVARGAIQRAVRAWFDAEGFTEVETAALQVSPGNEAHLHAFETAAIGPAGERSPLYLRTSPEFAAKKLLAAGEPRIWEIARVWRNRERGPLHHPEFTLLEWYRAGAPYEQMMADCAALLRLAAETAGAARFVFRGRSVDPFAEPERITLAEAFAGHAGIDLLASVGEGGETDREGLAAAARAAGVRVADDDTWADIFSRVLVERIEPRLGEGRATILCEYPTAEAALARPKPADPRVAERFELYACGVELANCFGELTDPVEQRLRFEAEMAEKARVYGERYPIDEDFLDALATMPAASGAALGFDRLVMLAAGAQHIEQVLWSPVAGG
jgi:lysyl-tRNA synthetase class 2